MKLKQAKLGLSQGGAGNSKPMSERVGKKDVREGVGGGLRRRSDMSVKERVGEARRQAPSIRKIYDFSGDQLSLCSDRFKEGLGETPQSHGSGSRAWNDEEKGDFRGHKKRRQTYKCKPLPEDLVLTELTDSGPVKKENFVKRAVAAKFSDESSEENEYEDEENGGNWKETALAVNAKWFLKFDAVLKERASLLNMCHEAGDSNRYVFGLH